MPKTFYTERDIVDLVRQGVRSLIVDDDVVLTDLAYEKARKLGLELLRAIDQPPAAPVRPYIAKLSSPSANGTCKPCNTPASVEANAPVPVVGAGTKPEDDLYQRVYKASLAKLGDSVDPKLLGVIVERVLKNLSAK